MLKQGAGAIVNTSSGAGIVGVKGTPAYVASLGGWENTEILNKCYGGIPEHIKAQIAKSIHVKFDTLILNATTSNIDRHF